VVPHDPPVPPVTLRTPRAADAGDIAEIWHLGWQDGHLGFVPQDLVDVRTEASFRTRALERTSDTTVATVDGAVVGFVMVVDDEVEQVYVSTVYRGTGIAAVLIGEAERQVRANGHRTARLAVVAGNERARTFCERAGWVDEGPFVYAAAADDGPIAVPCRGYTNCCSAPDGASSLQRSQSAAFRRTAEAAQTGEIRALGSHRSPLGAHQGLAFRVRQKRSAKAP